MQCIQSSYLRQRRSRGGRVVAVTTTSTSFLPLTPSFYTVLHKIAEVTFQNSREKAVFFPDFACLRTQDEVRNFGTSGSELFISC